MNTDGRNDELRNDELKTRMTHTKDFYKKKLAMGRGKGIPIEIRQKNRKYESYRFGVHQDSESYVFSSHD